MISDSPIGPSTGWLSLKLGPALSVHREVLTASGASASEMVLHGEDRLQAMLGESSDLSALRYRSLHLGNFSDFRTVISPTQECFLRDIGRIAEQHRLQGTSLHPDTTPLHVYQLLRDHKVPLGIENMDRNKASGKTVKEIEHLISLTGAAGVLDLQHCFEVAEDLTIPVEDLARGFAAAMLRHHGITHLHVSGEVQVGGVQVVNHAQLTVATNRDEILGAMAAVFAIAQAPIPIILEGDPLPEIAHLQLGELPSARDLSLRIEKASGAVGREIELVRGFLEASSFEDIGLDRVANG